MLTLDEIHDEMRRLSRLLDAGITALTEYAHEYAKAENEYRLAKAKAYLEADGAVAQKHAIADLATGDERYAMRLSDGMRRAAVEVVRSRRQQLSAMQSAAAAWRAEAEYTRTGPREGP